MVSLEATTISPRAGLWLNSCGSAQIMHVFKNALNLVDTSGGVLSLVTAGIGAGPFSLVVSGREGRRSGGISFDCVVDVESSVDISRDSLTIGSLYVNLAKADIWDPRPEWSRLAPLPLKKQMKALWELLDDLAPEDSMAALLLGGVSESYHRRAQEAWTVLATGLGSSDIGTCALGAYELAGLGPGLTPAGDDFLLGVIYAIHCLPNDFELPFLAETIKNAAIPRTTRLSAAWLEAGADGEASPGWHSLVRAMAGGSTGEVEAAARLILPTGHTSGADALAGFLAALEILSKKRALPSP